MSIHYPMQQHGRFGLGMGVTFEVLHDRFGFDLGVVIFPQHFKDIPHTADDVAACRNRACGQKNRNWLAVRQASEYNILVGRAGLSCPAKSHQPRPRSIMKRFVLLGLLLVLTGCSGGSQPLFNTPPVVATFAPANTSPVSLTPASKCQSRLLGRVTDANNQIIKDAIVDIVSGAISARATSDSGFGPSKSPWPNSAPLTWPDTTSSSRPSWPPARSPRRRSPASAVARAANGSRCCRWLPRTGHLPERLKQQAAI